MIKIPLQLIDKKDLFYRMQIFSSELDTLFPDPTIFNMRFNASYGITSFPGCVIYASGLF